MHAVRVGFYYHSFSQSAARPHEHPEIAQHPKIALAESHAWNEPAWITSELRQKFCDLSCAAAIFQRAKPAWSTKPITNSILTMQ